MQINFPIYLINKYKIVDPITYFCIKSETEGMSLTIHPNSLSSSFMMDTAYINSKLNSLHYSQDTIINREAFTEALEQANNSISEWLPAEQYNDENTEDNWGAYGEHQEEDGRPETRRQDFIDMEPLDLYGDVVVVDKDATIFDNVKIN